MPSTSENIARGLENNNYYLKQITIKEIDSSQIETLLAGPDAELPASEMAPSPVHKLAIIEGNTGSVLMQGNPKRILDYLQRLYNQKGKLHIMEKYDYLDHEIEDVIRYLKDNWSPEQIEQLRQEQENDTESLEEKLYDELWTADSVTGNGSGSYTFNTNKAEEYLCHNLPLLGKALEEFGEENATQYLNDPEAADVTIRCYLLSQAISEAVNDL